MPRSSRHKSHRSTRKHSSRDPRDRSDSEEEEDARDRKQRGEERAAGSGTRVSRDPEPEKRKSSSEDQMRLENGDSSVVEQGKKRKDRVEDSDAANWWNDGGEDDGVVDKSLKDEGFGPVELEKTSKSNLLVVDSKGRSSRRREDSGERYEGSSDKVESAKRKSEKDLSRRESSSSHQYRDGKERDRERGLERDKKVQDYRHERSDDVTSKKQGIRTGSSEEDQVVKKGDTEWQVQDVLCNPELQKELENHTRRGAGSGNHTKCQEDGRDSDDKRLSSRDDHTKNQRYQDEMHKVERHKDERHKDKSCRDKYLEDRDSDLRHRDDRHQDVGFSRDHNSSRSDSKHLRDENKLSQSRSKKSKLHDSDRDGNPCIKDCATKSKDTRGRKRSLDENDDHSDAKLRNAKEPYRDVEKKSSNTSKLEFLHPGKVDSSLSNNRPKSSASPSAHTTKDKSRCNSKQAESTHTESCSEQRFRPSAASTADCAKVSGIHEKVSESQSSEKNKPKDGINSEELLIETAVSSLYDRSPRSDDHISPIQMTEKSPSTASDQRLSNRSGAKLSVDIEDTGQKSSTSKDGRECSSVDDRELEFPLENLTVDSHSTHSQTYLQNSQLIPVDSSSINRTGHLSGNSPGHLSPPPLVSLGIDSPSVLGSYEDDNRVKIWNRKSSSRYKRNIDLGRGQGNPWTSGPTWPTPVPSGFIPFQNGPLPPGFHSAIQPFPTTSLFGMRPSLDMNPTVVSYHVHEMDDRFSGHGHSFGGWCNPVDDSFPQMQGWEGSNSVLCGKSHDYGRPDWDQNRHLMGSQGWRMNAVMWKGQSGSMDMEFSVPQKEPEYSTQAVEGEARVGQSGNQSCSAPDESTEVKHTSNLPTKNAVETPQKTIPEKAPGPDKTPNDSAQFCCSYLSKLDISLHLARPELYKQCMTLLPSKDPHRVCNIFEQGDAENLKEEIKVAVKSENLNSLFPPITDAIFQRAMSLYMEQSEAKEKFTALPFCSKEKDTLESSDTEKAEAVGSQTTEDPSLASANSASKVEEGIKTVVDAEGEIPSDTQEKQSDIFSDVFVVGSQASEPLMPECKVDLKRIHDSPESTH